MARTGQPSTRDVEATVRAVSILDVLADGGELGTTDVARRTGISPSTVSRQLGTLARLGLVQHVRATGRYRLGVRVLGLANSVLEQLDVRGVARPHLEQLVQVTGETATLSVPGDHDAITVDFVPGTHQVQPVSRLGRPSVAHASSAGKAMLAFAGRAVPPGPLRAYTNHTITDRDELERELERIRQRGYALAPEEREPGLSAVAAPVWSAGGELEAVIALQGPSARFDEAAIERALPLLLDTAAAISAGLGWTPGLELQGVRPRGV
jgi:IclR family transcriptional regulator, KDG regulon repressor